MFGKQIVDVHHLPEMIFRIVIDVTPIAEVGVYFPDSFGIRAWVGRVVGF